MNKLSGQLAIFLVSIAAIIVILLGVREFSTVINPTLLALVITITVLPIPGKLTKRGIPAWISLILTILMVILILGLVIMTIFFSAIRLSSDLPAYVVNASVKYNESLSTLVTGSGNGPTPSQILIQIGPLIQKIASVAGSILLQFGISLAIFFFMINAAIALPGASRLGLDPNSNAIKNISTLTEDVRHYMNILTGMNFLVGMGNTVFLWALGVDYAILWGILAWFMGYVPSIGFIIALIPPLLLAWAQYGFTKALIVLVGYILINGGVQNFIQPKIMGQGLKISPVVIFVGLFFWGFLLGGIGAMMAVPLTLLMLTLMENFEATHSVAVLMRYTGEEKKEEKKEAVRHVKSLWNKSKSTFSSTAEEDDTNLSGS